MSRESSVRNDSLVFRAKPRTYECRPYLLDRFSSEDGSSEAVKKENNGCDIRHKRGIDLHKIVSRECLCVSLSSSLGLARFISSLVYCHRKTDNR